MKRLLAVILASASVLGGGSVPTASGAGASVWIQPTEGEAGTVIEVGSDFWAPNVDVAIMAAYSASSGATPTTYVGPVARAHSDATGRWRTQLGVESTPALEMPPGPGILLLRAESEGRENFAIGEDTASFAVTEDGRRPNGAGELRLALSIASGQGTEPVYLAVHPSSSSEFLLTAHPNSVSASEAYEWTIARLQDGDWELLVQPVNGSLLPLSGGTFHEEDAVLCLTPGCSDSPAARTEAVMVMPFSVRDGSIVDVDVVLGNPSGAEVSQSQASESQVAAGKSGGSGPNLGLLLGWSLGGAVMVIILVGAGYHMIRTRRAL